MSREPPSALWQPDGVRPILAPAPALPTQVPHRIRIDRGLCSGYAECVGLAPEVGADDEAILDAARGCPVDAITVIDEFEEQV